MFRYVWIKFVNKLTKTNERRGTGSPPMLLFTFLIGACALEGFADALHSNIFNVRKSFFNIVKGDGVFCLIFGGYFSILTPTQSHRDPARSDPTNQPNHLTL